MGIRSRDRRPGTHGFLTLQCLARRMRWVRFQWQLVHYGWTFTIRQTFNLIEMDRRFWNKPSDSDVGLARLRELPNHD